MEDDEIIALFENRDESALSEIKTAYGSLMDRVAKNICPTREDAEEAVSDALMGLWNAIPPAKPDNLRAYCCKAARNSSLKCLERCLAKKRNVNASVPLEELEAVMSDLPSAREMEDLELRLVLEDFLKSEPERLRVMFVKRYFFLDGISEIAHDMGMSEGNVRTSLCRVRKRLCKYLERSNKYGK